MAAFDLPLEQLERYLSDVPVPADFDELWASTLADARRHDVLLDVVPVDTGLTLVDTWDVTFAGFEGQPVRAWYTRPAGVSADLPAVVEYLGYGRGRGLPQERLTWAAAGYAHLLMDTRGQGSQYGSGGDTPDPVGSGPAAPGFVTRGILDPTTSYYRRVFTDAVRAVDAVRSLPGVLGVAVVGNSQGGGIALAVSGLVPDLAGVLVSAPFLCDVPRALALTDDDPYGEIVRYLAVHRDASERVLRTLSYLDGVHFAARATAPALFATGLRDTICPPSTVFAAHNVYGGEREIAVYPHNHHEGGEAFHTARQLGWLADRLPGARPRPRVTTRS
ncbi:acetylxylan esterase [Cellulomonas humilata]|uniref:Acetylxylan esterase n=1 Tax=Cellulomonas humilata TaxID=144055 RepID=A0A7Y5ZXT0_9CELL|nr:acetylxylan esterase [Cellulomonas humilata]NUU15965.1 acetylxylan esterase [Cellulomonas humilata]